jgi:hypothetical protein
MSKRNPATASKHAHSPKIAAKAQLAAQAKPRCAELCLHGCNRYDPLVGVLQVSASLFRINRLRFTFRRSSERCSRQSLPETNFCRIGISTR